ncbi:MAG: alanine racemase [Acidimicrobiales bacterium]
MSRARATIDLGAIAHNTALLAALVAPAELCAVVKADGYGHGAVPVAQTALAAGARRLAVAQPAEAARLRQAGLDAPILLLSEPLPEELDEAVALDLDLTVYTAEVIGALAGAARRAGRPVRAHLKVDTGMHRVGAAPADAVALAAALERAAQVELAGVCTHCAVADEPSHPFTGVQLARFAEVIAALRAAGLDPPLLHAANSALALTRPEARFDLVRCGIALYGIDPSPELAGVAPLRRALTLSSVVTMVKRVPAGEAVSYGLRRRLETAEVIATAPIGYADGVPRRLFAARADALIGGRRRRFAGVVTMDQLMLACGDDAPALGDEVVLLGPQGEEEITAAEWAQRLGTIPYEIVCGIGPRVERAYVGPPAQR